MNATRIAMLSLLVCTTACSPFNEGTPCGGTRQVTAKAVLPDTGLGAKGTANITFTESEPTRALDETSLIVWTWPAESAPFADNTPRVRLVTDDGRVLLDLDASSAYQGSWYVRQPVMVDSVRQAVVSAFQAGTVWLELSRGQPAPRLTRVRPSVQFAGRNPVATCI